MARMIKTTQAMTLGVKFTTVFEDGTTAEHIFKVGDTVNDLRYVLDGEVVTVSGRLASIQYTTATKITWNRNNPSNTMMNDITLTNLVIDNSEQYVASTVTVPVIEVVEWAEEKNVARMKFEPFATYDITMHYSDLSSNTVSVEVGDKFDHAQFFNPSDPEHLIEGTFVVVGFAYKLVSKAIQVTGIAFQAEDGSYQVVDFENIFRLNEIYTYKVDTVETLKSKISELASGDTLSITAEIDNSESDTPITINKDIDLNLISDIKTANSAASTVIFSNSKSTISGSGKFVSTTPYDKNHSTGVIRIEAGADVTFNGSGVNAVMATPDEGTFGVTAYKNAKVTINDGEFVANWFALSSNGNAENKDGVFTINGGRLISLEDYAIYQPQNGTLIINDGAYIEGKTGAVAVNNGVVEINGGKLVAQGAVSEVTPTTSDGTNTIASDNISALTLNAQYGKVTCRITGGDFIGKGNAVAITKGSKYEVDLKISGGRFSSPITDPEWLAEGYVCAETVDSDGLYVVSKATVDGE